MKNFNTKFIVPLLFSFIISGCMPDSLSKFSKDATKKVTPASVVTTPTSIGSTGDTPAAPNLVTLEYFQLKNITQKSTSYQMHKYGLGNTNEPCQIPIDKIQDGQTSVVDGESDILCWLEADETQLFFNGADFQVNVPAEKCEYIQITPYYYWNAPPMNTKRTETVDATVTPATVPDMSCSGDYTSIGGPNCDEGRIAVVTHTATTDTTAYVACGGKRTNCYGGPGVDFKVSSGGFPIPVDTLSYNGESINYSVTAPGPLGKGFGSNHYISNFTQTFSDSTTDIYTYDYTRILSPSTGMGAYSATSSTASVVGIMDAANDPLKRADATFVKTGTNSWATKAPANVYPVNPFYEFTCLNYAHEAKARIRLQIREWNKAFNPKVYESTELSEASPAALTAQSGVGIYASNPYETSGIGFWNDITNWDTPYEYGSSLPYVPAKPGPGPTAPGALVFGFLFPMEGFIPK